MRRMDFFQSLIVFLPMKCVWIGLKVRLPLEDWLEFTSPFKAFYIAERDSALFHLTNQWTYQTEYDSFPPHSLPEE